MQEMQKFITNTKAHGGVATVFEKNTVTSVVANKAPVLRIINREAVIDNPPVQSQDKKCVDVDEDEDESSHSFTTSNNNKSSLTESILKPSLINSSATYNSR